MPKAGIDNETRAQRESIGHSKPCGSDVSHLKKAMPEQGISQCEPILSIPQQELFHPPPAPW